MLFMIGVSNKMDNSKSTLMLKYQKAKVKLIEYEVPKQNWPNFPLNYKELAFPTVLTISKYAEAVNDNLDKTSTYEELRMCSDYYDAAFQSKEQPGHDVDFALSGATAYFFIDDFGSAKVMWKSIRYDRISDEIQSVLYDVFSLAFDGRKFKCSNITSSSITKTILAFWKYGDDKIFDQSINAFRNKIYTTDSPQAWFWGEIVCAVANIMRDSSARILLPKYSALKKDSWEAYFKSRTAINLLWPSQKLVGSSNILQGKNAIVQLPTGVGKTKSIEIIIWSMFLSGRGNKAIIVAPLRSLCNEIMRDMRHAFPKEIVINQFSDVLEEDFVGIILGQTVKQILVCTPEKLQYIFHHSDSFFEAIDLYIFDESHMFDDGSRGALYELLLTDIKLRIDKKHQLVLLSAVLPNAEQIAKWLFGDDGALAYNSNIRSTPKAIGFTDKNHQIHYYSNVEENEDFFVPHTYNVKKLKPLGKERKERFFPVNAQDIALYYTNILCGTGGVAIYFNQIRSIPTFFKKIEDLHNREYYLTRIKESANAEELHKFQTIYESYYGKEYIFTKTVKYGILPHYSSLPNGIKISTEYAIKKNKVKAVACTSTLAQGVNIPIKYLLITGTNNSYTKMSVRNFQNLIGRTGRSGVYTGGDIIVTTHKLYDEQKQKGPGYYKWKEARQMFDATAVEACGSSILNLVKDFEVGYRVMVPGAIIAKYICDNISVEWTDSLLEYILAEINRLDDEIDINRCRQELIVRIANYKETVDSIENEMIFMYSCHSLYETLESLNDISNTLLCNSLAYYLADENEQQLLKQLFDAVKSLVEGQFLIIQKYSRAMVPIADANDILDWIEKYNINTDNQSVRDLLSLIEVLFEKIYPSLQIYKGFALSWICGDSYEQMSKLFNLKMYEVEKTCQFSMSYQMSFLVGNIVDLVDSECVNLEVLRLLQQALRYGVKSRTEISICERVFNDRFIAKEITNIIGNKELSLNDIVHAICNKKKEILLLLANYPSYFESVIHNL